MYEYFHHYEVIIVFVTLKKS